MKITQLTVQQQRLSSAESVLWIIVHVEAIGSKTLLCGCLVGPRCTGVETVQINYPIRQIYPDGYADNVLVGRIVIPEPNLWTSTTPFIYEGNVELWHDGALTDMKPIRAAFKTS
jgi:hypothetical protein